MTRIILLFTVLSAPTHHAAIDVPEHSLDFTQDVINALPSWDDDPLAQYEQEELSTVRADLADRVTEEQLHKDWDALFTIDKLLKTRKVI